MSTTTLNKIIAVEKGAKASANEAFSTVYQKLGKADLIAGLTRTYQPLDESERGTSEAKNPQITVTSAIEEASAALARLFDVELTKEKGNTLAKANIEVDGQTILPDAPATYLLFLEKQLVDIHTFVAKLPTLDPAETWTLDTNTGVYVSAEAVTARTKKALKNHIKYEATKEHPAQVETYTEDVTIGHYTARKFSGAIPQTRQRELLRRVERLQEAVKVAREQANMTVVPFQHVGQGILGYIFA